MYRVYNIYIYRLLSIVPVEHNLVIFLEVSYMIFSISIGVTILIKPGLELFIIFRVLQAFSFNIKPSLLIISALGHII